MYRRSAIAFEKGPVAAMTAALFCDECGAALQIQAASCAVCGHPLAAFALSPALPAAKTPTPASSTASDETLAASCLLAQRYRVRAALPRSTKRKIARREIGW